MNTDLESYQGGTPEPYERPQVPTISRDIIAPRLPEVGRIRLGEKDEKKGYPKKLSAFRFTSRNRKPLDMVAELWGGTVVPWASDEGPQWQVYTTATSIECIVPKAELAFSQHFEDWEGATCNRCCDGHWEMQGDRACVCDPADRQCKPTTRLSVLLPDVPGMGVWRVESHGYNAAAEILGTIELAAMHGATLLPCTLTLENRSRRRYNAKSGKVETNRFVVPVLAISASLRQMVAEQAALRQRTLGLLPMAEPATPDRMRALRTAVFSRWPDSVDEPERSIRLRQLSALLGRSVTTISSEHDLTAQEAIFLANAVNELPDEDTTPALTREQAAPSSSPDAASAAGADSTAPQGSAGEQGVGGPETPPPGSASHASAGAPAEHHTAEVLGEVAPADGTVPEGRAGVIPDSPPEAAPAISPIGQNAPKRKRYPTDPTGAPGVAEAVQQAQQFRDDRKARTETWQPPSNWLQTLPPEVTYNLVTYFERGGAQDPNYAAEAAARAFARHRVSPSMPPLASWTEATEWAPAQLVQLAAETWDRPARKGDSE